MDANGSILAFVDLPEGELDDTGKGLLSYAARFARTTGSPWSVVTPVTPTAEAISALGAYGTPGVTWLEEGSLHLDTPGLIGRIVTGYVRESGARVVLLPHNDVGSTLAPVIAAALDAALMTETVMVRQGDGGLHLSRQALGARLSETRVWDGTGHLVITVPLRSLSQVLLPTVPRSKPVVTSWNGAASDAGPLARVVNRIPPDPQTVDLTEAEIIFSAGKGCDKETFDQLKELCRLLNVSFGVTRPVYDLGWTGFERMVGQTGRTVTPRLYLALGISGSMHHVGGIKDSRRIVAINTDPKAPIFPNCDDGFVADVKEVLPCLLERARVAGGAQ